MNKTIKPILAISLMAILLTPLGGCNQPTGGGGGEPTPPPTPEASQDKPATWDTVKQELDKLQKNLENPDSLDYATTKSLVENWNEQYKNWKKNNPLFSKLEAKKIDKFISDEYTLANVLLENLVVEDDIKIQKAQDILKNSGVFQENPDGQDGKETKKETKNATAKYLKLRFKEISIYTEMLILLDTVLQNNNGTTPTPTPTNVPTPDQPGENTRKLTKDNQADVRVMYVVLLLVVAGLLIVYLMKSEKTQQEQKAGNKTPKTSGRSSEVSYYDNNGSLAKINTALQHIEEILEENKAKNLTQQVAGGEVSQLIEEKFQILLDKLLPQLVTQQPYSHVANHSAPILRENSNIEELRTKLSTVNSELENAQLSIKKLTQEKHQLTQEKQQLTQEKQQLTREKQQLTQEKDQLTREKQQLTQEKQQLTQEKLKPREKSRADISLSNATRIASVGITLDSFSSARQGTGKIRLNSVSGKSYLVVQSGSNYYLTPDYKIMRSDEYNVAQHLFDCSGYQQGVMTNVNVLKPAQVARASDSTSEWVLVEKGELSFY